MRELLHESDRPLAKAALDRAAAEHKDYDIEYRVLRPCDQRQVWVAAKGRGLYDETGNLTRMLGVVQDITQRKQLEERAREILESITDAFFSLDRDWRFTYVNKQAEKVLNRHPGDLLGKVLWEEYPGLHGSEIEQAYHRTVDEQVSVSVTSFYADHNHWYEVHAYPAANGISVYFRDVTDRKRVEASILESEERHRAVLAALDEGISLHDENGTIIMANASAERILGLTLDQLCGRDSFDRRWRAMAEDGSEIPGEQHPPQIAVRTGQNVTNFVMAVHRPDGTEVWVSVNSIPLRDAAKRSITGAVTSFFDITDRRRIEKERERLLEVERAARADVERASHIKDEFLATLSHELRTPLNAILGWSQILARGGQNDADLAEGLAVIERNARAQTQIIEDLLDMSRIISGKVRLDVQRVDLATVVESAVDSLKPAADAKGIRLQVVLDPDAGPVSGDPNRLQQVMWNLLSNAVKFTKRGGRVQVLLEQVNSQLEVSVIDTGEGIRPEFLAHVFDRFRQADASTSRRHGGLGLGLSIVKQLVELHGGSVSVKSDGAGLGAMFTVTLPLFAIQSESVPEMDRPHPQAAPTPAGPPDACLQLTGMRVLVVDDEPDARALIKRLLEDCKAVVAIAGSAAEGMQRLLAEPFDVLVSDIGMPGEDGYAFIRRLRSTGQKIPAVALSAYARSEDRVRAIAAGFQHHVAKPVEPAELITIVASLCNSGQPE